jgi:hypothetical protein
LATAGFDTDGHLVPTAATEAVIAPARSADDDRLQVALSGLAVSQVNKPSIGGVGFGILAAADALFAAFGSVTAMALHWAPRSSRWVPASANVFTTPRRRSGLACTSCSCNHPDTSILGLATIAFSSSRDLSQELVEDASMCCQAAGVASRTRNSSRAT